MKISWIRAIERELNHLSQVLLKNAELIIYDRAGWQADQGNMAKGITMANNQTPGCEMPAAKF